VKSKRRNLTLVTSAVIIAFIVITLLAVIIDLAQ